MSPGRELGPCSNRDGGVSCTYVKHVHEHVCSLFMCALCSCVGSSCVSVCRLMCACLEGEVMVSDISEVLCLHA